MICYIIVVSLIAENDKFNHTISNQITINIDIIS